MERNGGNDENHEMNVAYIKNLNQLLDELVLDIYVFCVCEVLFDVSRELKNHIVTVDVK